MGLLEGQVAFISGVARGQGRSHAIRCAEEGADVIGFDSLESYETVAYPMANERDLEETVALVEKTGQRIHVGRADVRDREKVAKVLSDGISKFGRVDIVAGNAGIFGPGSPFWLTDPQELNDITAVNAIGVWNTVAVAVPSMIDQGHGGSVVITSSGIALRGTPGAADYAMAKMGIIGFAKSAANELAAHRIRVNVICPTTVATDMVFNDTLYKFLRPDLETPTWDDAKIVLTASNMLPDTPTIEPRDVSEALVWLSSDRARYVTGVVLPVDAGLSARA